eukprot:9998327-Alexandrium_andersonii.AAC.1
MPAATSLQLHSAPIHSAPLPTSRPNRRHGPSELPHHTGTRASTTPHPPTQPTAPAPEILA